MSTTLEPIQASEVSLELGLIFNVRLGPRKTVLLAISFMSIENERKLIRSTSGQSLKEWVYYIS